MVDALCGRLPAGMYGAARIAPARASGVMSSGGDLDIHEMNSDKFMNSDKCTAGRSGAVGLCPLSILCAGTLR